MSAIYKVTIDHITSTMTDFDLSRTKKKSLL